MFWSKQENIFFQKKIPDRYKLHKKWQKLYLKSDKWEIRGNSELEIVDIYVPKMTIKIKFITSWKPA